ncbi:hypothetical protein [Nucisporomicrobium flavum]|uniref:hypothetical protein n=1 Tax=Nucisporomicrobium flavum TaxID=2785915 RepID=UPI0018F729CA|nr:hypothetical protein [Nucisporomicrobium flavum]
MSEFSVDAAGLNSLYNVFVRASGDASDSLDYTRQHCDLSFTEVGLIMRLISPHKHAYGEVTDALTQLKDLAQGAGTQINAAQKDYARTDEGSAARLDAGYPGAKDPISLRGTLSQGRPDLRGRRSGFTDVAEPTAHLKNPEYAIGVEMWSINPLADLISPSAWLRQVSIWLFSYDPFEGWASQFSGDWKAYVHCGNAMGLAGAAAYDIGRNLTAAAADVPAVWRGKAAEAEQEFQLALGGAAMDLQNACRHFNELYLQAAEAVKKLLDVVSGLISDLLDVLIIINASAAVGTATIETVVGPIAGYGVAAYYTWQAYDLYKEISSFFGNAEDLLKLIGGSITGIKATLAVKDLPTVQPYKHPAGY